MKPGGFIGSFCSDFPPNQLGFVLSSPEVMEGRNEVGFCAVKELPCVFLSLAGRRGVVVLSVNFLNGLRRSGRAGPLFRVFALFGLMKENLNDAPLLVLTT